MISAGQRDKVRRYQALAVEQGVEVLAGGGTPQLDSPWSSGFFVEPTVWAGAPAGSALWREEIFGPVCAVAPFDSEREACDLVNAGRHGLSATIFSHDGARAARVARALDVGVTWINSWLIRDLRTPFGGVGQSGVGREGGVHSFDFFSEVRQVTTKL